MTKLRVMRPASASPRPAVLAVVKQPLPPVRLLGHRDIVSGDVCGEAAMAYHRVTVFGGSGFVGRQIVKRLAGDGADVRVAVRRPERASFLTVSQLTIHYPLRVIMRVKVNASWSDAGSTSVG